MEKGFQNEFDFINYLNKNTFEETNIIMQEFLKTLFPNISKKDTITAYKYGKYAKVDIVIVVNGVKKGISIKSGNKNSVHLEKIEQFIDFLCKFNFSKEDLLLRYLYADGTNNNTGTIRQTTNEYNETHCNEIKDINFELNKIKKELIKRFLIKSDINYEVIVDAFILGTVNDFLWATADEVLDYLCKAQLESSSVHISSLFIQNWNKNLKYNLKYEHCRNYIQVKWYSLFDDIIQIMNSRKIM